MIVLCGCNIGTDPNRHTVSFFGNIYIFHYARIVALWPVMSLNG